MRYLRRPVPVKAVQLSWQTWSEVCDLLGPERFAMGFQGVTVDDEGVIQVNAFHDNKIGLMYPMNDGSGKLAIAVGGEWIVAEEESGKVYHVSDEEFRRGYMENEPKTNPAITEKFGPNPRTYLGRGG